MKRTIARSRPGSVCVFCVVGALCLLGGFHNVFAQRSERLGLEPEKAATAQELEAKCVTRTLKLADDTTAKLVTLYQEARASHRTEAAKIWSSTEGDRSSKWQEYVEMTASEREKLKDTLGDILTDAQVSKALASLGTFTWGWDRMVDILAGLGLDDETLYKALGLVNEYVANSAKSAKNALTSGDWESVRTVYQNQKTKLDSGLKSLLTEEQLAKWTEASARQGG